MQGRNVRDVHPFKTFMSLGGSGADGSENQGQLQEGF